MKKTVLTWIIVVGLFAGFLSGCESDRTKPSDVSPPRRDAVTVSRPEILTEAQILARAAAQPPAPSGAESGRILFDGKSLSGWRITYFVGAGTVECRSGLLVLGKGGPFTGVNYTNEFPKVNYEVTLEAMRVAGDDFFCGLTFPVRNSFCSLILGGWGGSVVGLSNLDGADASENETTQFINFDNGRWYRVRLRVSEERIEAWIEQKKIVDVVTTGRKISVRFGDIEMSKPFGIASWMTSAAVREIKLRTIAGPVDPTR